MNTKEDSITKLAEEIALKLKPYCSRIKIAGSIRRHSKHPGDIDIVLIPKDNNKDKLEGFMDKLGKRVQGGEHESTWKVKRANVELYYTTKEEFGAELLAYSSRKGSGIGLRMIAKRKGLKLTQHGLFNRVTGKKIAGKSEKEIYEKLGRKWKPADKR